MLFGSDTSYSMQAGKLIGILVLGCNLGFIAGYLSRPSLDPDYIRLMYDPGYFGHYYYSPHHGWIILDLQVINERYEAASSWMP